jgi:hypothetical protein
MNFYILISVDIMKYTSSKHDCRIDKLLRNRNSVWVFKVLMALTRKIIVFWDVKTFSFVDRHRRFGGICCRGSRFFRSFGTCEQYRIACLKTVVCCRLTETVTENEKCIEAMNFNKSVLDDVDDGILRLQLNIYLHFAYCLAL